MNESEIIKRALEDFQRMLRTRPRWIFRKLMGEPPRVGLVRQWAGSDLGKQIGDDVLALWRVTADEITKIEKASLVPKVRRIKGMYFDAARCDFAISADLCDVSLEWALGPRFGRGFKYRVVTEQGKPMRLKWVKTTMVS